MAKNFYSKDDGSYKMMRFNKDGLSVELPVKEMVFPFDDSEIGYINCKGESAYIINKNKEILSEEYAYCEKETEFLIQVDLPHYDKRGNFNFVNKEGNLISDKWFHYCYNARYNWYSGCMTVDIFYNHQYYCNIVSEKGKLLSNILLKDVDKYEYTFKGKDKNDIRTEYVQLVKNENNEWNLYWKDKLLFDKWEKNGTIPLSNFSKMYFEKYDMKYFDSKLFFG